MGCDSCRVRVRKMASIGCDSCRVHVGKMVSIGCDSCPDLKHTRGLGTCPEEEVEVMYLTFHSQGLRFVS